MDSIFLRACRTSAVVLLSALVIFLSISGCGPSPMMKNFQQAGSKQYDLDNSVLKLWKRSPTVDSGDFLLTSASDLEQVPRAYVDFSSVLDQNGPLVSENMVVVESEVSAVSPVFFSWAGRRVPWDTTDFSLLMAFSHASKALELAKRLFPDAEYSFESYGRSGSSNSRKLVIYGEEVGDPFDTSYNPKFKTISFYKDPTSAYLPFFNPVLEGDAIYHEVGHYVMQAYVCANNPDADAKCLDGNLAATERGLNPDMDTLQEGLADYFAAVVAGDDRTLTFFSSNARYLVSPQYRLGTAFSRLVNNRAKFPEGFRQDMHFDGRVVAGALNDFRRYLDGTGFVVAGCAPTNTSSDCRIAGSTNPMSRKAAEEFVLRLAFETFREMTTTSGLYDFANALKTLCVTECVAINQGPGALALLAALKGRGLISTYDAVADGTDIAFSDTEEDADVLVNPALKWRPYPDNGGAADLDAYLEPCELVMVYPDLENLTLATVGGRAPLEIHNIGVSLLEYTGFGEVSLKKTVLDPLKKNVKGEVPYKMLGWLNPGESFSDLVGDSESRLYTSVAQSTFTRPLGKDFNVPSVGWLVYAPNSLGATGTMKLRFSATIYNGEVSGEVIQAEKDFTLSLSTITAADGDKLNLVKPGQISNFTCTLPSGSN